jgi:hypothetical protein
MGKELPLSDSRCAIHAKKPGCDAAFGGQREYFTIAKLEVVTPTIDAWMKQRRDLPVFRIYRGDVTAFESIADGTTQCEILCHCFAAMLCCDHVINLVFRQRESF